MRLSSLFEERSDAYANANARVSLERMCTPNLLIGSLCVPYLSVLFDWTISSRRSFRLLVFELERFPRWKTHAAYNFFSLEVLIQAISHKRKNICLC